MAGSVWSNHALGRLRRRAGRRIAFGEKLGEKAIRLGDPLDFNRSDLDNSLNALEVLGQIGRRGSKGPLMSHLEKTAKEPQRCNKDDCAAADDDKLQCKNVGHGNPLTVNADDGPTLRTCLRLASFRWN